MVKSMIESKAIEEATSNFKKQYDELRKCITNQVKLEQMEKKNQIQKAIKNNIQTGEETLQSQHQCCEEELRDKVRELEEEIEENKESYEKSMSGLHQRISNYRQVIVAIGILYFLTLLYFLFWQLLLIILFYYLTNKILWIRNVNL